MAVKDLRAARISKLHLSSTSEMIATVMSVAEMRDRMPLM
jgi:hypothetical protein